MSWARETRSLSRVLRAVSPSGMIRWPPLTMGFAPIPGRWLRPMRQHAVFVSLRLLIRRSVPNLDRWSPSIDKSSSFMFPFRHRKLSWLLVKRQPVSSAILIFFHLQQDPSRQRQHCQCARWFCWKWHNRSGRPALLGQRVPWYCQLSFQPEISLHSHLFRREWWRQRTRQYLFL